MFSVDNTRLFNDEELIYIFEMRGRMPFEFNALAQTFSDSQASQYSAYDYNRQTDESRIKSDNENRREAMLSQRMRDNEKRHLSMSLKRCEANEGNFYAEEIFLEINRWVKNGRPENFKNNDFDYFFPDWKEYYGINEKFSFIESYDSPLSSHFLSPIKWECNGSSVESISVVHAMAYWKAQILIDRAAMSNLTSVITSDEAYQIGRKVSYYDKEFIRKAYMFNVLIYLNFLKFKQNPHLKKFLIDTNKTTISIACLNDDYWAIGLDICNPNSIFREMWKGLNLFGEILTLIRRDLQGEIKLSRFISGVV
jgi:ribA/ribD-fused uncharacterized protein